MFLSKGYIYVLLGACCYSLIAIAQMLTTSYGASLLFTTELRVLGSALVLWVWLFFTDNIPSKHNWPIVPVVISSLGLVGFLLALTYGINYSNIVFGTIVPMGLVPLYAYFFTWVFYRKKHSLKEISLLCLVLVSLFCIANPDKNMAGFSVEGMLTFCAAGLSYTVFLFGAHLLLRYHKPEEIITVLFTVGGIAFLPALFIESLNWKLFSFFILIDDLAIITTIVATFITVLGLSMCSLETSAIASLCIPLIAVSLGMFFFDVSISWERILGLVLLATSVVLVFIYKDKYK